jgi:hypothetical protein
LSGFAVRHGLEFILERETPREGQPPSVARALSARKLPVLPAWEGAVRIPIHSSYRDWGFNN